MKKTALEKSNTASKVLLDTSAHESKEQPITDQDTVVEEMKFLNQTWHNVSEKLSDVKKQADNIDKELVVFYDKERTLEDLYDDVDSTIDKEFTVSTLPEKCAQEHQILKVISFCFSLGTVFQFKSSESMNPARNMDRNMQENFVSPIKVYLIYPGIVRLAIYT